MNRSRCLLEKVNTPDVTSFKRYLVFFASKVRNRLHTIPIFFPPLTHMKSNPQPPPCSFKTHLIINHQHVVRLTTGSQPLPKRVIKRVLPSVAPFNVRYLLVSLRSSSSSLRLLPFLLVTSSSLLTFPSMTCFRKQFLRKT